MKVRLVDVFLLREGTGDAKLIDLMKRYAQKFGHEYNDDVEGEHAVGPFDEGHASLYLRDGQLWLYHWNPLTKKRDSSQSNNPIDPQDLEKLISSNEDPAEESR